MMRECSFKGISLLYWLFSTAFTCTLFPLKPLPLTALLQIGDQLSDKLIPRSEG